jgi:plastocyanin
MRRAVPLILALALMAPAAPAQAGQVNIEIHDNFFMPDDVGNRVGDTVRWFSDGSANPHNVHHEDGLFHSGDTTTAPIDHARVFSAGTFYYFCQQHGVSMDGFVRIPVRFSRAPSGLPFTVIWATAASETGTVYDVQFRVGSGDWRVWKRDTTALRGRFGKNGNPVRVRDGKRYSFRGRSQLAEDTPDQRSRWSPVRSFRP